MKIVYTCITGGYDRLLEPLVKEDGWRYICFTDADVSSPSWEIVPIDTKPFSSAALANREYKLNPSKYLPPHSVSVYVDGNMQLIGTPSSYLQLCGIEKSDFIAVKHWERDCVYEEIEACRSHRKALAPLLDKQRDFYLQEGLPKNVGLYACGVLVRKNEPWVRALSSSWTEQVNMFCHRDQVSLPYVLWKSNRSISRVDVSVRNQLVRVLLHGAV